MLRSRKREIIPSRRAKALLYWEISPLPYPGLRAALAMADGPSLWVLSPSCLPLALRVTLTCCPGCAQLAPPMLYHPVLISTIKIPKMYPPAQMVVTLVRSGIIAPTLV